MTMKSEKITVGINDLEKRNEEAIFDALNAFNKKCPYCGKDQYRVGIRDKIEVDHFVPISKGGQNVPWNLVPICKSCNRKKSARLPKEFLDHAIFQQINAYLLSVKNKFEAEGIESYANISNLTQLIEKHSSFIQHNSHQDFIKELVHLVCIDKADALLTSQEERHHIKILDMLRTRTGEFQSGVIGSPFQSLCDRLATGLNSKVPTSALMHALAKAGWIDCGRLSSGDCTTKKHIFKAPNIEASKSELRRMCEPTTRLKAAYRR